MPFVAILLISVLKVHLPCINHWVLCGKFQSSLNISKRDFLHRAELALFAVVDVDKDAAAAVALGPELVRTVGSVMEDDTAAEMECHC